MPKVKICGITNTRDASAAVAFGADALGFVFFKGSPRYVTPGHAAEIISGLPPFIATVGVFVNEEPVEVERVVREAGLSVVQFHGEEPPEKCATSARAVKAIRVRDLHDLDSLKDYIVSAYLLDSFSPNARGGTGRVFDWDVAKEARQFGRIILAGGLTSENVAMAISKVRPYAVDVSSGVELEKGIKDHEKLRAFILSAKRGGS